MSTTTKKKLGIGAAMALKVIEEGARPMSPAEIKAKYQLDFPFSVKRVVEGFRYEAGKADHDHKTIPVGVILTFTGVVSKTGFWKVSECDRTAMDPDSKRFVLA